MIDNNKLQEEIIKADIKEVERLWKNSIQDNSLDALLEKMTKEELVKVAKRYSVKGLTSLKKADIVVTTGGVSVGDYDFVQDVIKDKLKAKTGTLSDISSIAGYLTSKSGKKYVFCIMTNDIKLTNSDKKMLEDFIIREAFLRL